MSSNLFTHISKFISLGAKTGGLAALLLAATLDGTSVLAQQQAQQQIPAAQPAAAVMPLPAVSNSNPTSPVQPVGYISQNPDDRMQQLEQQVAQQQSQMEAQQIQVQALVQQLQQSGGSAIGGSAAQAPAAGASPAPYIVGSDRLLVGAWGPGGPVWSTKNGDFKFHPRGLVQMDVIVPGSQMNAGLAGANNVQQQDSATFRRLRFGADGTMYDNIDWVAEFDMAFALQNYDPTASAAPVSGLRANTATATTGGTQAGNTTNVVQPTTVFMTFKEIPIIQNIRVGNQQDWFSFEHIESARFLDFMERSPLMDAFSGPNNNGYTPGISGFRNSENQRFNIQGGVYHNAAYDSGQTYNIGSNSWQYGGRVTWTPYYDEATNGRYMLHVGFAWETRTFMKNLPAGQDGTNIRIRSRGDLRNASSTLDVNYADTGNFYATSQTNLNPEFMWQHGPLMVQGEYVQSYLGGAAVTQGGASLGNVQFHGGYVEALYFLTGENRNYNRVSGVFDRVQPFQNAFSTRTGQFGWGAWQPGVRLDWLDLNSGAIHGGQNVDMTLGMNWFLNSNARFQMNYVLTKVDNTLETAGVGGTASLWGSRYSGDGFIQSLGCRMDFNW